jgi:hypothetical protein
MANGAVPEGGRLFLHSQSPDIESEADLATFPGFVLSALT